MSEFSESSPKEMGFSSLLISNFHLFRSFVLSHPFYFSYIIFFSPYMFKILSFLSPLVVTTTILLLALLTTLHGHNTSESHETQPSFLFSFCSSVLDLEPKFDDNNVEDFTSLEEYKMVVEACAIIECASENESNEITFVDKFCSHESTVTEALDEEPVAIIQPLKFEDPMDLEKEKETEKCEKEAEEEDKVKPKSLKSGPVQPTTQESKVQKFDVVGDGNDDDDLPKFSDFLREEKKNEDEEDVALRSFGSMRKEKEWRRTLACKLFEERHNADVGQGMDQLWETYETETEMKKQTDEEKKTKTKLMMMKTKSIEKDLVLVQEEDEEDEDGIDQQQLCCLQALKFSTKKMHLGIARPNLLKLSKAFKGFGRFYKHPKKA